MYTQLLKFFFYFATVLAIANAGDLSEDLGTSRNEIIDLIEEKFEDFNIDFTSINAKLKLLRLPQLNPNLLQLILTTYNTSTEEIADIILEARGNPEEFITNVNEIFKTQVFYIQGDVIKVDQSSVNEVISKTKDKYINDLSENHQILAYVLQTFIGNENKTYYPEIVRKVQEIQVPLHQISLSFKPTAIKTVFLADQQLQTDNTWEQIGNQFRSLISTIASTFEDLVHKALNEFHLSLMSLYREGEPENVVDKIYANTINVLVLQLDELLQRADELVDEILSPFVSLNDPVLLRDIRDVESSKLGFLDGLLQSINRTLKGLIHSGISALNNLTGGYFLEVLETLEVLLGGLVNQIFPDKEMLPLITDGNKP